MRVALAKTAVDKLGAKLPPGRAGRLAVNQLDRVEGRGGLILVDRKGRAAAVFNTPRMARGIVTERAGLQVGVGARMRRPY